MSNKCFPFRISLECYKLANQEKETSEIIKKLKAKLNVSYILQKYTYPHTRTERTLRNASLRITKRHTHGDWPSDKQGGRSDSVTCKVACHVLCYKLTFFLTEIT